MGAVDRQFKMGLHRLAMVAPRYKRDRRPEFAELRDVRLAIGDSRCENRPENLVSLDATVELPDQPLDQGFGNPRRRHNAACQAFAPLECSRSVAALRTA
jgi:hypothetical protein